MEDDTVAGWIARHARPLEDLEAMGQMVGKAVVIGVGRPTHGAHELSELTHRMLGALVERHGFRALALEVEGPAGGRIDDHLRTGEGDPRVLLGGLPAHHRTEEMLAVLRWMRERNRAHPDDPVRFVGLDPDTPDPPPADRIGYVEPRLADNVVGWHERTGDKVVHWGGFTHTAVGAVRTVAFPPAPPATHRNAGSYMRDRLGAGYLSIALTFDHGWVDPGAGPQAVPPPPPGRRFAETMLGKAGPDSYLVDLRGGHSDPVRVWLDAPATLRLMGPRYDPAAHADHHMTGGSLAEWFDVVGFVREVSPTTPISRR
jgi:erythromycin esterase